MDTNTSNPSFVVFVNGTKCDYADIQPEWMLINFLREKLNLKGAKIACGEGGCGACTVILSKFDPLSSKISHAAINACITPLCSVYGCHVLTVEGIAEKNKSCHPIQDLIARKHGTQCGFCTPGMVMSMYALAASNLKERKELQPKVIKSALQGNLCRCTGYRPILEAFKDYQPCSSGGCAEVEDLCSTRCENVQLEDGRLVLDGQVATLGAIEELLTTFAKEMKDTELRFVGKYSRWWLPRSLEEAFSLLRSDPTLQLVGGATEVFQETLEGSSDGQSYILLDRLKELRAVERCEFDSGSFLKLGAALTISQVMQALQTDINSLETWKTRSLRSIARALEFYGSQQIRNSATVGGSLKARNPASDIQTFYEAFDCWAHQFDFENQQLPSKKRKLPFPDSSIITHLEIPYTSENEYTWMDKATKRKNFDGAIVNAAGKLVTDASRKFIQKVVITFGGISIFRFTVDCHFEPKNVAFNDEFLKLITDVCLDELKQKKRSSQYSAAYIVSLVKSLLVKFYEAVAAEARNDALQEVPDIDNNFKASQLFRLDENGRSEQDLVGKPIVHASAYKHATGEAQYCDDVPKFENELFMVLVLSEKTHANIVEVDASPALAVEGVVGYVSHEDPQKNSYGMVIEDEEIFASSKVTSWGQIIGGIVATDRVVARKAAKLVKVVYKDIEPVLLTIEDAVKHNSYYVEQGLKIRRLALGEGAMDKCDHILEGEMTVGSQAHFYLEPQSCIVIPKGEDEEIEVISSTQNPMDVQRKVAEALNIPSNRVVVRVRRIGGGFGGKESRCMLVALPAAVAARKYQRPVRCILDRQTDMTVSGKRHGFKTSYRIGFTKEGRLLALEMKVYCNGGSTLDISEAAIERALVNLDNAYNILNYDLDGMICKTNLASNTVFRGTGGPQAALLIEGIMDRIGAYLSLDPVKMRRLNMYEENDVTPYGQKLTNVNVRTCWDECVKLSDYYKRRSFVEEFNRTHKYVKRGLSMNPCHYGVAYTAVFLNQGAALVHIYRDGSVLITHGGVEIGQGLNTKMIQVATRELGIQGSKIRVSETSTDKVPNATPTSASSGSDLMGMAVMIACQELRKRLEPYLQKETVDWENAVNAAYFDRVSLSATGFYKTPKIGWNSEKVGNPFNYYSTGTACTEVELDCLTGNYKIVRTDIVMDIGKSLNPAIDIGQVEGAYMQGVGLFTLEELVIDEKGKLTTLGPNSYKIPSVGNVPTEFNVSILPGSSNPHAVYSSKGIGEPPLLLATSVFYALKDSVRAHRKILGMSQDFRMDSPATPEKVLLLLQQH